MEFDFSTLSLEEGFVQLENIAQKMQEKNLPLSDSVALYAQAKCLMEHVETLLTRAQNQIEQVEKEFSK